MLEKKDLYKKIEKKEYKRKISDLEIELGILQRKARDLNIPVIIVFEGWDAAGKGTLINNLILNLDSRGFKVYPINAPNEEEKLRPFLWRFWIKTPAKGRITIFDRSWYGRVLVERVDKLVKKKVWKRAFKEINSFEQDLVNDCNVIVKFFLHISKDEQKKRFKKIRKNPSTAWKVTKEDLKHHKQYDKYLKAYNKMLEKTDTEYSQWTVIEAHDERFATLKIFDRVISSIKNKIKNKENVNTNNIKSKETTEILENFGTTVLNKVDLSKSISKDEYKDKLNKYQKRLFEIEHEIYLKRIPVIILYEGWDAAGKGGNIKRLVQSFDPRGYTVIPVGAPNDIERKHHYLWRFWRDIPKAGHIAIFDRSWYGRVLVERVEGFCKKEEWQRAYSEINEMEEQFVNFGNIVIKFWLQIDKDEQIKRFKERENNPYKKWKITEEDYRNREKWDEYEKAVDEMLIRTSTTYAPWTIIEANCKHFARIKALKTIIDEIEKYL